MIVRVPGRAMLGALSVGIGVCALTLLLAAGVASSTTPWSGPCWAMPSPSGSGGTDLVAVVATVLLGVAAVADVLYLGIRERAAELATLRATVEGRARAGSGWRCPRRS